MVRVYATQTHEGWLIPTVCVVYGALAIFTAFTIAKNISLWCEKVRRKLPASIQDHSILQNTTKTLIVLMPSLLWPVVLAIALPIISIARLSSEIEQCRGRRRARRQSEPGADLERGIPDSQNGGHSQNGNEQEEQAGEQDSPGPAMTLVTEPPPVYTPYARAHTTHQGQWRRSSDRDAERYCFRLNNDRTPEEMLRSATRVTMIPAR